MANESTSIWFQDPTVLFKKDQLNQIWPKEGMSRDQKINAITRLVIILTVLGYLVTQSLNFFITGAITLGVIVFLYYAKTLKEGDNKKEVKEAFTNPSVYNSVKCNFTNPTEKNPLMNVLLNEYVEVLKDDIHSYNLILFNSLNMIVTLVEDDMITFYEIHEMFDTLNMFDSKHEKDVSQKLTNIGDGLKDLMYEVRRMGNKISNSIQELSYVTEQSNQQLTEQLIEIDSTMKVGNLISTINTYQNYKNNRRLNR